MEKVVLRVWIETKFVSQSKLRGEIIALRRGYENEAIAQVCA